ncbi:thermonuclease family protein [Proteiniclasticum ruminis]|uniref:Micrococcal nuclease n=1 Tax=Proteiniclasticum ruminis TaxID=398199 RepID=A0A1I5AQH3_9CLOT|nr:hypothetical protein [Proteiniclasticum ruminis]SFN64698.1 micrococcal nuclease [Proteiniclasticum ruminis]
MRIIGVNTPESSTTTEPYGKEAGNNIKEITKETITKYMFNAHLLLESYGQPYTSQPDSKYAETFIEFAREARENEKGLWNINPESTTKGADF